MKQFEYDVIPTSRHLTGEFLSAKGEQGWELVSHTFMPDIVVAHIYTFKKEKIEDKEPGWNNPLIDYLDWEEKHNKESEWEKKKRLLEEQERYNESLKELNKQKEERELVQKILEDRSNANGHDREGNPKYIYDGHEYILDTSCKKILAMSFERKFKLDDSFKERMEEPVRWSSKWDQFGKAK